MSNNNFLSDLPSSLMFCTEREVFAEKKKNSLSYMLHILNLIYAFALLGEILKKP